jgi:hypothetical protein
MEGNGQADGTVAALAELMKQAKLSPDQRALLLKLSKERPKKEYVPRLSGPHAHAKLGDKVTVVFAGGHSMPMTVTQASPSILRLSKLDFGKWQANRQMRCKSLMSGRGAIVQNAIARGEVRPA